MKLKLPTWKAKRTKGTSLPKPRRVDQVAPEKTTAPAEQEAAEVEEGLNDFHYRW